MTHTFGGDGVRRPIQGRTADPLGWLMAPTDILSFRLVGACLDAISLANAVGKKPR